MHQLPKHRDSNSDLSGDGCPCHRDRLQELHSIHRTLPARRIDSYNEDFLQTEDLWPILDETNGFGIFDDLKA